MNSNLKSLLVFIAIILLGAFFFVIFFPLFLAMAVVGIIYAIILRHRVNKELKKMQQQEQAKHNEHSSGRTIDHNDIK